MRHAGIINVIVSIACDAVPVSRSVRRTQHTDAGNALCRLDFERHGPQTGPRGVSPRRTTTPNAPRGVFVLSNLAPKACVMSACPFLPLLQGAATAPPAHKRAKLRTFSTYSSKKHRLATKILLNHLRAAH